MGKFGCPVLSGQETHMPSTVEPYSKTISTNSKIVDYLKFHPNFVLSYNHTKVGKLEVLAFSPFANV